MTLDLAAKMASKLAGTSQRPAYVVRDDKIERPADQQFTYTQSPSLYPNCEIMMMYGSLKVGLRSTGMGLRQARGRGARGL